MTLSERNNFFKAGIFFSSAVLMIVVAAAHAILPAYPELVSAAEQRSFGLIQALIHRFLEPAPYVAFATVAVSVVYALITMVFIYYFFEKTQAPEIFFFTFFILSFSFEAARIMPPLTRVYGLPSIYFTMTSRVLLFGRYFGLFSLFTASVYAAGLNVQKQGNFVFVIIIAALMIALRAPVDGVSWDSSLSMITGYSSMFKLVEAGIMGITMISFFVSSFSRGAREYIFIGIGSCLVFFGRNILLGADTWVTPLPGLIILGLGTWFICTYLHRVYLWL
ncbi:MAG: hypothetical protein LBP32_07835 [Spirochaetaceae bacterium]|nr:hypothetical protein [Spirochaetaceae bacterium]